MRLLAMGWPSLMELALFRASRRTSAANGVRWLLATEADSSGTPQPHERCAFASFSPTILRGRAELIHCKSFSLVGA